MEEWEVSLQKSTGAGDTISNPQLSGFLREGEMNQLVRQHISPPCLLQTAMAQIQLTSPATSAPGLLLEFC